MYLFRNRKLQFLPCVVLVCPTSAIVMSELLRGCVLKISALLTTENDGRTPSAIYKTKTCSPFSKIWYSKEMMAFKTIIK